MSEIVQADSPTLAESYSECVNSFGKFVLALGEPDCDAICRDQVRFPQIYEEFGRIRIWGDQSKADLLPSARGSLDDRLRQDSNLKLLVLGILQRLKLLLWQATHIAQRKYDVGGDVDHGSVSSVTDSDYSTDDEDESQRRTMPKIRLLVQQIADQIRSLHEISSLLRRPTVTNKSIHSINTGVEEITLQRSGHIPLNRAFEVFDNNHILEKVLQWRGLSKSLRHITFSEENVAPASNVSSYQEVEGIRWLCERLAKANTRRREELQHWKHRPYNSKQTVANAKLVGDLGIIRALDTLEGQKEDSRSQINTVEQSDPRIIHETKSISPNQSLSAISRSDVTDTDTCIQPQTIYTPTTIGQDRGLFVPEPPRSKAEQMTFQCPYCGMTLESTEMEGQSWKRRVFRDLHPYICTFPHCHNAEELFASRHEWKNHEFQVHRREYACQWCQVKCSSRKDMSTHLQGHHRDPIPPVQLDIILDLGDKQVDPSDSDKEPCILCGKEVSLSIWHDHVAAHMENLSLFVLPAPENHENEKPEGSINSHKADLCDLNNFSIGPVSETGSLGFSAAESHSQPPAESASIPAHKEVEYTFKSSTREATDEDDTLTPTVRSQTEADIDEFMELKRTLQRSMRSADWEDCFATMIEQTSEFQKRKMALGLDHPDTLESMHALAFTYRCNGRLNKAGSLLAQVVQLRTMVLGPEHLDTLNSMESLASMYGKRGRFRAAKALYSNVLESYERSLGLKNALAINVVERLGRIYVEEGQLQEATFMYERTLRHCKKGLELGDPAVLALASKLKRLYISQGRFQDAKAIH